MNRTLALLIGTLLLVFVAPAVAQAAPVDFEVDTTSSYQGATAPSHSVNGQPSDIYCYGTCQVAAKITDTHGQAIQSVTWYLEDNTNGPKQDGSGGDWSASWTYAVGVHRLTFEVIFADGSHYIGGLTVYAKAHPDYLAYVGPSTIYQTDDARNTFRVDHEADPLTAGLHNGETTVWPRVIRRWSDAGGNHTLFRLTDAPPGDFTLTVFAGDSYKDVPLTIVGGPVEPKFQDLYVGQGRIKKATSCTYQTGMSVHATVSATAQVKVHLAGKLPGQGWKTLVRGGTKPVLFNKPLVYLIGQVTFSKDKGVVSQYLRTAKTRFRYVIDKTTIRHAGDPFAYNPPAWVTSLSRSQLKNCLMPVISIDHADIL